MDIFQIKDDLDAIIVPNKTHFCLTHIPAHTWTKKPPGT
jgi:hypothetical protein